MLILFIVRIRRSVCWNVSAVEGGSKGAGGGLIVACGGGVRSTREGGSIAYRDAILSVVDASTVGEDMDICAFRTKLAVSLCKVFADVLSSVAQIMTERTGITSLTSTLTKELARNVGRIRGTSGSIEAGSICHSARLRV